MRPKIWFNCRFDHVNWTINVYGRESIDLVLLEVNVKKSEILKLDVGLLIDLIRNSISDKSKVIIRGGSLSLISLSL